MVGRVGRVGRRHIRAADPHDLLLHARCAPLHMHPHRLSLHAAAAPGAAACRPCCCPAHLAALGGAQGGDGLRDDWLQELHRWRQPDDVRVGKQVVEEGLHVVQAVGAAQVEQQDADALGRGRAARRCRPAGAGV